MASFKFKSIYEVVDTRILGIEKGNVNIVAPEKTFIALRPEKDADGKDVKVIMSGTKAFDLYNFMLANGNTISEDVEDSGFAYRKDVKLSFIAFLKENRTREVVLHEPHDMRFDFTFKIKD